jgi:hypothetical protein
MLESVLDDLITLLAFAGGFALVLRLLRSAVRLALRAAEVTAVAGMAEVSARRGDLTGMAERRTAAQQARRARARSLALALLWLLWLALPPFLGWAREAYALAAPLWLTRRK